MWFKRPFEPAPVPYQFTNFYILQSNDASRRVKDSEERYRRLVILSPDPIVILPIFWFRTTGAYWKCR
ncbi:hypothetical protein J2Z37_000813 [Ammoniphilus resinae]|uniref:Uncharacterized protein n=1 Tax=Ammoniphilus resinae TaxID=861532 RepID=A0ABS4GKP8_9BACL|nr:hypothetical protein [Ammoniphilus resinae]